MGRQVEFSGLKEDTMTQHTPGPWGATTNNFAPAVGRDTAEGGLIATMDSGLTTGEAQANARLIAAVPELLGALERILASTGFTNGAAEPTLTELTVSIGALREARAAIAKAT